MTPPRSDHELLEAARSGDDSAYAELWSRHVDAAGRAARQFDHSGEAEDIVAEAFVRILAAIRSGGGPVVAFRPYLFRTVSNIAQRTAGQRRVAELTDEDEVFDEAVPFTDPLLEGADRNYAVQAYRRLSPEHQAVVWYVDVERVTTNEAARLLGMTRAAVASMAYRAREALRREFLQVHIETRHGRPECRQTLRRLGAYVRGTLAARHRERVEAHLEWCEDCREARAELVSIAASMRAGLVPLVGVPAAFGAEGWAGTPGGTTSRQWALAAAAAAVAVLVVGAVTLALIARPESPEEPGPMPSRTGDVSDGRPQWPTGAATATHLPTPSPTPGSGSPGDQHVDGQQPLPPPNGDAPGSGAPTGAGISSVAIPGTGDPAGSRSFPGTSTVPSPPSSAVPTPTPTTTPTTTATPTEPPELPELDVAWAVLTDDAWDHPDATYFAVAITGASAGADVELVASSPLSALVSPIAGVLPPEPPLTDDGVWDCGDWTWKPQQVCVATADEAGGIGAFLGVESGTPGDAVDVEIIVEGRESQAVTLWDTTGCPAPGSCGTPDPPDPPDNP